MKNRMLKYCMILIVEQPLIIVIEMCEFQQLLYVFQFFRIIILFCNRLSG